MMDGSSCKRNRRTYNNKEEESAQFCNRIGCHGRLKHSSISHRPSSSQLEPPSTRSSSRVAKIVPASSRTRSGQLQVNKKEGKDMHKNQRGSSLSSGDSSSSSSSSTGSISRSSGGRYGLRSLNCSSISDVVPRGGGGGGSSSESKNRREMVKKRIPEEGVSSLPSRGKRSSVAPSRDEHASSLRRTRNQDISSSLVMPRRSVRSVNADAGVPSLNRDSMPVTGFRSVVPRSPRPQVRNIANRSVPYPSSLGASYRASSSYATEQVGDDVPNRETLRSSEHSAAQVLRRHNLHGAAEVLLALERLEQDEELTYEQLLGLENNLFFGNLYFYDQHREMRLDIDNMSYEELLALEDRMGSVSTALSEDAFAKCVKRTLYQTSSVEVNMDGDEDEAESKCSICQEEYSIGDEIGRLGCEHGYHVGCLQQWLQLKNWCPVCKKAAAAPAP